jgi:hypothetical protein
LPPAKILRSLFRQAEKREEIPSFLDIIALICKIFKELPAFVDKTVYDRVQLFLMQRMKEARLSGGMQ